MLAGHRPSSGAGARPATAELPRAAERRAGGGDRRRAPGATARARDAAATSVATRRVDAPGARAVPRRRAGRRLPSSSVGDAAQRPGHGHEPGRHARRRRSTPASSSAPAYGYLETRDGTLLVGQRHAARARPRAAPTPPSSSTRATTRRTPTAASPRRGIAQLLGYATVGVNLRGTGCSGGAFDYFEPLQSLDGYDVIETVAAQPWVAHGTVGMVGISYPGITQLFVAATRPPHLAAITPLSVLDDTYDTLYPGGILNDGFALAVGEGPPGRRAGPRRRRRRSGCGERIADGDATCETNQALRLQSRRRARARSAEPVPDRGAASDALAPATFVRRHRRARCSSPARGRTRRPASHFANMLDDFAPASREGHAHERRARRLARPGGARRAGSSSSTSTSRGASRSISAGRTRWLAASCSARLLRRRRRAARRTASTDQPDYATALAPYEAEPPVRVLFDVGAGDADGAPIAAFETTRRRVAAPATPPRRTWYFGRRRRARRRDAPAARPPTGSVRPAAFPRTMPRRRRPTTAASPRPKYDWKPLPDGQGGRVRDRAARRRHRAWSGTGSVDLWLRSTRARRRPRGDRSARCGPTARRPTCRAAGCARATRALDAAAFDRAAPGPRRYAADDAAPLPAGELVARARAAVPVRPRVPRRFAASASSVQPPGGNRPSWAFDALDLPTARSTNRIGIAGAHAVEGRAPGRRRASTCRPRCPRVAACGANRAATTWPAARTGAQR